MARHKEFDEDQVLDQALELFRARGYQQTSFSDLTVELGVSRQSLYDTYGDKQALYHTALRRYLDRAVAFIRQTLESHADVREAFTILFERTIQAQCATGNHGCLMVNSMIELSGHDPELRALAALHARNLEGLFVSRLSLAQRQGNLSPDKDPVALSRFYYHTLLGLAVGTKAFGDPAALRDSARMALQLLG